MPLTRTRRRILIAATASIGILFIGLLARPQSPGFFDYLSRHPAACHAARVISTLGGRQKEFDEKIIWSKLRRIAEQQREW